MPVRKATFFVLLALLFFGNTGHAQNIDLSIGLHKIRTEVVADERSRQTGLMYRSYLAPDDGMLFIFESKGFHCFWMRNTKIPLSIAFMNDDGKIVHIEDMQAMTENNHCPTVPVRYALEVNQGWFKRKGISLGNAVSGLPK